MNWRVRITSVERTDSGKPFCIGYSVDCPAIDATCDEHVLRVAGWALTTDEWAKRCLRIYSQDLLVKEIPINLRRPDVFAALRQDIKRRPCGFDSLVSTIGLLPTFELELRVVISRPGSSEFEEHPIAVIRGEQNRIETNYQPQRQPLTVTALGRSGTTWLMHLLSQHPEIIVNRTYPYEVRVGGYWMHAFRVLAAPANHYESAHPDSFEATSVQLGHNPFNHPLFTGQQDPDDPSLNPFGNRHTAELLEFCQRNIDRYYDCIAQQQQPGRRGSYFCEKAKPARTAPLYYLAYEQPRELFLVRDFRDLVSSIIAFNEKRGFVGFERSRFESDDCWIQYISKGVQRLVDSWNLRRAEAHLVHYESLVREPGNILAGIFSYLKIDDSSQTVSALVREAKVGNPPLSKHRTAQSVESSIGRWKSDMPADMLKLIDKHLADHLKTFGYA